MATVHGNIPSVEFSGHTDLAVVRHKGASGHLADNNLSGKEVESVGKGSHRIDAVASHSLVAGVDDLGYKGLENRAILKAKERGVGHTYLDAANIVDVEGHVMSDQDMAVALDRTLARNDRDLHAVQAAWVVCVVIDCENASYDLTHHQPQIPVVLLFSPAFVDLYLRRILLDRQAGENECLVRF